MKLSQYLHNDIVDVLKTFGDLNDVVNKILDAADEGYIEVEDKPPCRDRDGCDRYNIDIHNENYLELLRIHGVKSKQISLRRLLYWFVENEIYEELGWTTRPYITKANFNTILQKCQ